MKGEATYQKEKFSKHMSKERPLEYIKNTHKSIVRKFNGLKI